MHLLRPLFSAVLLSLVCLAAGTANAQGTLLQQYNCVVTMPSGPQWAKPVPPSHDVKVAATTTDRSASVLLTIVSLPSASAKLDARFIEQFEQGYFPAGRSKKISGTQLVLQGVPAYRATGEIYVSGKTMQTAMYLWFADGRAYQIAAMKLNAPPLEDAELRTAMNSFQFLSTPKF